jgi:hypothetical protein
VSCRLRVYQSLSTPFHRSHNRKSPNNFPNDEIAVIRPLDGVQHNYIGESSYN